MAACGSSDGLKLSELEELKLGFARQYRKLELKKIVREVEKLNKEIDKETEKGKSLRTEKILTQVKKLCKDDSVRPHEYFDPKTTEFRITKKSVRLYMFGLPMAKLIYDRDSTAYNDPLTIQDFKVYVQAAINAFNKTHSTEYVLVEVVRAFRSLPIEYNYSLFFTFTTKLAADDDDTAAKTFQAVIIFDTHVIRVLFVDFVDPREIARLAV